MENLTPRQFKGQSLQIILPFILLFIFLLAFWSIVEKMLTRWGSGDNSYCYMTFPIFLYLCWEKKNFLQFDRFSWSITGVAIVLTSVVLLIIGEVGSMETLLFLGIWGSILGTLTTLYGKRVKELIFSFVILLFMIPLPPFLNQTLTFQLKLIASSMAAALLRISGLSVLTDGNIIDLGDIQLQVVDACSGLRYLMPMLLMTLILGHITRVRGWRRLYLLVIGLGLTILINVLRIWISGWLIMHELTHFTEGGFHDATGIIIFLIATAILTGIAKLLANKDDIQVQAQSEGKMAIPPMPLILPISLTIFLSALFFWTGRVLPHLQSEIASPLRISFDYFPQRIGEWQGTREYLPDEIIKELWADDYISINFSRPGSANYIHLLISYYGYQGTHHTAHAPQSCLLGSGWSLLGTHQQQFFTISGERYPVEIMELKKGSESLLSAYFFLGRGRVVTNPWYNKLFLLVDSLMKRRSDGALVRAEMWVAPGQPIEIANKELLSLLAQLWPLLPDYVPGGTAHY